MLLTVTCTIHRRHSTKSSNVPLTVMVVQCMGCRRMRSAFVVSDVLRSAYGKGGGGYYILVFVIIGQKNTYNKKLILPKTVIISPPSKKKNPSLLHNYWWCTYTSVIFFTFQLFVSKFIADSRTFYNDAMVWNTITIFTFYYNEHI